MTDKNSLTTSALERGFLRCHDCHALFEIQHEGENCPRCGATLHARTPNAVASTWALLLTASILLIPANVLPIMTVKTLGQGEPSTIFGGVVQLAHHGLWGIAAVVLIASVLIPIGKIIGLLILLISVQGRKTRFMKHKMIMYRMVVWIGRWSMLDIFVVGILIALVRFGNLAEIEGNAGATAFAGVVVFTMLAANRFDTRLIWDIKRQQEEE